jgi:hypothetical protein
LKALKAQQTGLGHVSVIFMPFVVFVNFVSFVIFDAFVNVARLRDRASLQSCTRTTETGE